MTRSKKTNRKSFLYKIEGDDAALINKWINEQSNVKLSLNILINACVQQNGFTDVSTSFSTLQNLLTPGANISTPGKIYNVVDPNAHNEERQAIEELPDQLNRLQQSKKQSIETQTIDNNDDGDDFLNGFNPNAWKK